MVYTITLNPAIDHVIICQNELNLGITNYYDNDYLLIGGKGINNAITLKNLNVDVKAIGILGKDNKDIFLNYFNDLNLKNNFFINKGSSRINFKIKNLKIGQETEINGKGFDIEKNILNNLIIYLQENLKENDILVLTGSIAKGIDENIYQILGNIANYKKAILIVDANKLLMLNVLKEKPYLIKPNLEEMCQTLNIDYQKNWDFIFIKNCVSQFKKMGAQNILLSLGKNGSYYFDTNNNIYKINSANGKLINSVGSGDSMLAGFIYGLYNKLDIETTLKYASASGSATAFKQGLACKEEIEQLLEQIKVEKI